MSARRSAFARFCAGPGFPSKASRRVADDFLGGSCFGKKRGWRQRLVGIYVETIFWGAVAGLLGGALVAPGLSIIKNISGQKFTPKKRFFAFSLFALFASAVLYSVILGLMAARKAYTKYDYVKTQMAQIRAAPLMGVLLRDVPSLGATLQAAMEADFDDKAPGRARALGVKARADYIQPAYWGASDAAVLQAGKARRALMVHLHAVDVARCREFAEHGIKDITLLDPAGRQLFEEVLRAQEAVYLDGKGKPAAFAQLGDNDWRDVFTALAFTGEELRTLVDTSKGSDQAVCDVGVKLGGGIMTKLDGVLQQRTIRMIEANS